MANSSSFINSLWDFFYLYLALTETWFNEFDAAVKAECIPNGYKLLENS